MPLIRTRRRLATRIRGRRSERTDPLRVTVGGLMVIALSALVILLGTQVPNGVPGASYKTMYVDVPEVGNLLPHDPVRIAGVRVGQVIGRGVDAAGRAHLELQLDPNLELRSGTGVMLRANGLLGARYVELIPGHGGRELPARSTIRGGQDSFTYGLPEALDTFDAQTRGGLGATLNGLGEGFLGHGTALNHAIAVTSPAAAHFQTFALAVLSHRGAPARLIPALDAAVAPLDANRINLSRLMGVTGDALGPLVSERAAVRRTIDLAPGALSAVTANAPGARRLVDAIRSLSDSLIATLPAAPSGLTQLSALLRESRIPLLRATSLLQAVPPAVPGALRITSALSPVLPTLLRTVRLATPTLRTVAPYKCDVENFGAVMRSMTGYMQPGSPGPAGPRQAFRLQAVLAGGLDALGIANPTPELKRDTISAPCLYPSTPYPQLIPSGPGG